MRSAETITATMRTVVAAAVSVSGTNCGSPFFVVGTAHVESVARRSSCAHFISRSVDARTPVRINSRQKSRQGCGSVIA